MMLDSKSLPVERIVHRANKFRGFSAGEAALDCAVEDWSVPLPTRKA